MASKENNSLVISFSFFVLLSLVLRSPGTFHGISATS